MNGILCCRRAYVTGGSSGIGASIVKAFAAEGARVAIGASQHADQAMAIGKVLPKTSGSHFVVQADLFDYQQTKRAVDEVIAGLGGLDIFVHCAGIDVTSTSLTHETSNELWNHMMGLHLNAAFHLSKLLIPTLLKGKNPSVLFIGSVCGLVAWEGNAAYSVAKAGLHQFARCIASDYAKMGLRANAIAPGVTDTPLTRAYAGGMAGGEEAGMRELASLHPVGRYATTDEIGSAAVFLASDKASFITGVVLPVDGGLTIV